MNIEKCCFRLVFLVNSLGISLDGKFPFSLSPSYPQLMRQGSQQVFVIFGDFDIVFF
jgi:hypothetical protein